MKTYPIAVFSFPCMVPIDCHKRIFYKLKALNDIAFPFFDIPCYLNPSCLKPKYNISHIQMKNFPTKVKHLPNQNIVVTNLNAVVTKLERCRYQTQTLSLPTSIAVVAKRNAVVTKIKRPMSRGRNEHD